MRRIPFKKEWITSVFITMLLATILNTSFLPEATARTSAPTGNVFITPESGHVGDVVRVIGEINTTDGPYLIFFDQGKVKNGTATGTAVNDTFVVPPRPMGNYTVKLHDITTKNNFTSPTPFDLQQAYHITAVVPSPPEQLQEGESTMILVNVTGGVKNTCYLANVTVTDPSGRVYYNDTLRLTNTTDTGYGEGNIAYPADFSSDAHTNHTGTYLIAFNETTTANFTVGLTDKLEYRRIDCVNIQGAGYKADEIVTVNITYCNDTFPLLVEGYPKTENASDGIVIHKWRIPDNATLATYNVTLTGAVTRKSKNDTQNFTIVFTPLNESEPLVDPPSGRWEDQVRLIGEVETFGGNYTILWDGESIKEGTCVPNSGVVNDTLIVPISVKGDHEITLYDNTTKTASLPSIFQVTTSCRVSAKDRIQEGKTTTIKVGVDEAKANATYTFIVNVTDPAAQSHSVSRTIAIDGTFSGENSTTYWPDFTDTDANTDYVGTYNITVITANKTLATGNFTVGLTDKTEYVRRYLSEGKEKASEVVIQGSGYGNETVTINITYYNDASLIPVKGYPKTENASDGIVFHRWKIPNNATLATYNVTLTRATIDKLVKDTQNFTVIEIIVSCQAQNKYDNESLAGVSVEAYLGIFLVEEHLVGSGITNGTGWVDFLLDRGYYSFGTYWREVEVGSLSFRNITKDATDYVLRIRFYIKCELAHIIMIVSDEDRPLPFINVTLANLTLAPDKIPPFETNYTGIISTHAFTNTIYRIEARRYGHLFFNQSIGNLTVAPPLINITCPTYTLFIHASDSKEHPLQNATVKVIEWSSGRIAGEGKTSEWGSVRLDCTLGRYKVRVYNYSEMLGQTVILKETVIDLTQNQFYLELRCRTVNLDLSVKVIDYLGQPIPNAKVTLNLTTTEGVGILNLTTDADGIASQNKILGGDYRIFLYLAGRFCGVRSLCLDESREIIFQVGDYVMVGTYLLERNQLITGISLAILVALSALALIYRRHSKKS